MRPGYIAAHTTGFEALQAVVRECTPQRVAQACGIRPQDLATAARWFACSDATLSLWCQGLNQSSSGTANNAALINLHLATGQIGRPGAGPFSLTGQANAMGGREVGALANLLPAHRDPADPAHRAEVAALWGVPALPEGPGKTAVELFEAAADGAVKALWIACTNPAQSMPDQTTVRRALERAELVVVQEAFATTATCAFADLLLPATSWGEKEGTVTNSERRISRVRAAVPPPGEARHDWQIAVDFARRLEARLRPGQATLFPYTTPESIWLEHRASTRGRDLDITGLSYARLEQAPQQWPFPEGAAQGRMRLYEDHVFATADGRARFAAVRPRPPAEPGAGRYPISLTTGRLRDQWHGMSRTGTLGRLFGHVPEPVVQLHPRDLGERGLAEGDLVHVTSRRGSIVLPAQASAALRPGQAFIAMHWGGEFLCGSSSTGERLAGVNALTISAYCPTSKQPELKHAAVKILKAELPWRLLALAWLPAETALAVRGRLQEMMARFPFAACVPFARDLPLEEAGRCERSGVLFRAAAYEPVSHELLDRLEALLGLDGSASLRYEDRRKGQRRTLQTRPAGRELRLEAVLLAGDTRAEAWLKPLLQQQLPLPASGRGLLAPGAQPPAGLRAGGRQVCACVGVDAAAIEAHLAACGGTPEGRLASLQAKLRCGTGCGSCVPELKRMIRMVAGGPAARTHPGV